MPRPIATTAALGLALLAVAVPAAAQADYLPHVPVPAGQLQHTVTETTWPAATNTFQHHALQTESWIGATAGRSKTTDVVTGKVTQDCQYTLTVNRCWESQIAGVDGLITPPHGALYSFPGNSSWLRSWDDQGAAVKDVLNTPKAHESVTGTTTFLGRPAVIITQTTGKDADGGTSSSTTYAEADNDYPLWTENVSDDPDTASNGPHGPKITAHVDGITQTKTLEIISPAGVQLTIDAHPGAQTTTPSAIDAHKKAKPKKASHKKAAHKKASHKKATGYTKKHKGYAKKAAPKR